MQRFQKTVFALGDINPLAECPHADSHATLARGLAEREATLAEMLATVLDDARGRSRTLDWLYVDFHVAAKLEAAQSAWEAFRDAHCAYLAAAYALNENQDHLAAACRIAMTRERVLALAPVE